MKTIDILKTNRSKVPKNVTEVDLHQKDLVTVPNLKEFPNLRKLNVSCNKLKQVEFFSSNASLETLIVYDNELRSLNGISPLINLTTLHAQYNRIKNIDSCFQNLLNLTDLRLDDNEIERVDVNALRQCLKLENVDLSYNCLEDIEVDADQLPRLSCLSLSHNRLHSITVLSKSPKLSDLDVSDNLLKSSGLECAGFEHLEKLNLSNNRIASLGGKLTTRKSLVSLHLSGNQLISLPKLGDAFPNLDVLEVSGNRFQNRDDLLASLTGLVNLRELTLQDNPFVAEEKSKLELARSVKNKLPDLACLNAVCINSLLEPDELTTTRNSLSNQRELFNVIEEQLAHLSALTTPLEDSLNRSFNALQDVLNRMDIEESAEEARKSPGADLFDKDEAGLDGTSLTPKASLAAGDVK